jgi:hypothetical protein
VDWRQRAWSANLPVNAEPRQYVPECAARKCGSHRSRSDEQWAADYNEIKDLGGKDSTKRSAQQTEDGRFWLITGPQSADPMVRQIAMAQKMSVIDCARQCLKAQYDTLAGPVPSRLAALVKQLEKQKWR